MLKPASQVGLAQKAALALFLGVGLALAVPADLHIPLRCARYLLPDRITRI
jgi:hypothetical protein